MYFCVLAIPSTHQQNTHIQLTSHIITVNTLPNEGENKAGVLENMEFRRIFGPRRDEVTGEWKRLDNE